MNITKSEWYVVNDYRKPKVKTSLSKDVICEVNQVWIDKENVSQGQSHNEMMNTANLIASAPDLLEALEYCMDSLENEFDLPSDCIAMCKVAIQKAKGEK